MPEESYTIPFGEANVVREGDDVTIVAMGRMVALAEQAADELEASGVSGRSHRSTHGQPAGPGHYPGIGGEDRPARRRRRGSPRCNLATDISAQVVSEAFGDLRAPIKMVSPPHVPVPFAQPLEDLYIPSVQDIVNAAKTVTEWSQ